MAIETDLSVAPYFDEAAAGIDKNYYKILFKPSVPVQVRELNEFQTILQNQIEEFGDNILKRGTIIKGCAFSFYNTYPYVKIADNYADGQPVDIGSLQGKYLTSTSGHRAIVLDYIDGFEQSDPDTKTLYVKYINSGDGGGNSTFSSGAIPDQLTVSDVNYSIPSIAITTAGTGYSNNDAVLIVSQIAVNEVTGNIVIGRTLLQANTGASAVVVAVDKTTYVDKTIIKIRPTNDALANSAAPVSTWTFSLTAADTSIVDDANSQVTMTPIEIIGTGATAVVTTDSSQRAIDISMTAGGRGYYVAPYAAIRSTNGGTGAVLVPQNYYHKAVVYNGVGAIGNAYAFGVSEGVVYQKGYFLKVPEQTVVVSKYSQYPNNVSVGFRTWEEIVDAYEDTALLDNATGTRNYTAPGADRLKLTPELIVLDTDEARANTDFFPIVEFSEGIPYKQNRRTSYNAINDEMSIRTADSAGDYVVDKFLVACKSTSNASLIANTFTVVVDPGTAYIDGYRTQTYGNYQLTVDKGIDTQTKLAVEVGVSVDYGSYVTCNNVAGSFDFSAGATVRLFNTATNYLANTAKYTSGTITPSGQIGTARVRQIKPASGTAVPMGTPEYKMDFYLFDIIMNPGKSFKDVRSLAYYDGSYKGVADVVLTSGQATLTDVMVGNVNKDKMVFYSGFDSPLSINTMSYTYRTFNDTGTYKLANDGIITISLTGNKYFPYSGSLSSSSLTDLVFFPLTTVYANNNIAGTANVSGTGTNTVIVSASGLSIGSLATGDYVSIANGTANVICRVTNATDTYFSIDQAISATDFAGSTVTRVFPKNVPIQLAGRSGVVANVSSNSTTRTLSVGLGTEMAGASATDLGAAFNIRVVDATPDTRRPHRNLYVKIAVANNMSGFGLSGYGNLINGSFTSGSADVAMTDASTYFSAGQNITVVSNTTPAQFYNTSVGSANATHLVLSTPITYTGTAGVQQSLNLNGPWCLGIPDVFRLRGVYQGSNSSVSTDDTDITREFDIDHNQNLNYYGLSYLVKEKNSTLVLAPTDWLLVKFDALKQSVEGDPVHINSYVDSVANNRFEMDARPLSELDALTGTAGAMNTLEIPEVHAPAGTDIDLISSIDFRPRAANTAAYATTSGTATVNPGYAEVFSAGDKKFPVPDSTISFNATSFLGRVDTVYVDSSGKISVSKGHPTDQFTLYSSKVDELVTPVKNKKVMVLNNIRIPPYPSIEERTSTVTSQMLDKSIINENNLNKRNQDKKIIRLFTKENVELEQPRAYKMEDIGTLERRIKDLEYYVALTNMEIQLKELHIPSSLNSTINRAKYGFFADNFDSKLFTNEDDPEYKAVVDEGRLVPAYELIKVIYPAPPCEYTDYRIIDQPRATGNSLPVAVTNAILERKEPKQRASDISYITMANTLGSNAGTVSMYCFFYSGADELYIYQSTTNNFSSNTPIYTSNNTVALSNTDIAYMSGLSWFKQTNVTRDLKKHQKLQSPSRLRYGGKLTWNHNPANGRYYKIFVKNDSVIWRYRIEYPINTDSGSGSGGGSGGGTPNFNGHMIVNIQADTKKKFTVLGTGGRGKSNYNIEYERIKLTITGVKPNTKHKLSMNKIDVTALCDTTLISDFPPPTAAGLEAWLSHTGTPASNPGPTYIMSDNSGKIEVYFYPSEETKVNGKDINKTVKLVKPLLEMKSDDGSSYASAILNKTLKTFRKY